MKVFPDDSTAGRQIGSLENMKRGYEDEKDEKDNDFRIGYDYLHNDGRM